MRLYVLVLCLVAVLVSHARGSSAEKLDDAIDFAKARAKELFPEAKNVELDGVSESNPLSLKYGVTLKIDEKFCNIIVMEDEEDKTTFRVLADFQCR